MEIQTVITAVLLALALLIFVKIDADFFAKAGLQEHEAMKYRLVPGGGIWAYYKLDTLREHVQPREQVQK